MSSGKKKGNRRKSLYENYFLNMILYLIAAAAVMIIVIVAAMPKAAEFVHKAEAGLGMSTRHIRLDDSSYNPLSNDGNYLENGYSYGQLIGNITCENAGLNCNVYYGANRISMKNGSGLSGNDSIFGLKGISFVTGYDETYFYNLKYCEKGDVITVTTNYGEYSYKVTDTSYIDEDKQAYRDDGESECLVLSAVCSDFSEHSGECFYVFADRIDGEVN